MNKVTLAATQMACDWNREGNVARGEKLVRQAAAQGAQIILLQELFETPYFCQDHSLKFFDLAHPLEGHPAVEHFQKVARELQVVLPISLFERANNAYYNTVVMLDADGSVLGFYRKSHIPESPGYHEKFYFSPGDTGFKVFDTAYAKVGVAICWDQWFPETARAMALMGAEVLFYPTAIGTEPHDATLDTAEPWRRAMQGHAVSNVIPVVAANRIGTEKVGANTQTYYGHSFIANHRGDLVESFGASEEGALVHEFDLDFLDRHRAAWGFFRDRRTEFYR